MRCQTFPAQSVERPDSRLSPRATSNDLWPPISGPLPDASEVARFGIPTVMMFVQSLHGISHNKIKDTKEEHLELAVTAFDKLTAKAIRWIERSATR